MVNLFFHIFFIITSIYVFLKSIFYAIYEIKTQNNKSGGISFIVLSTIIIIFSNIVISFIL